MRPFRSGVNATKCNREKSLEAGFAIEQSHLRRAMCGLELMTGASAGMYEFEKARQVATANYYTLTCPPLGCPEVHSRAQPLPVWCSSYHR
jgi:hypothetical protein